MNVDIRAMEARAEELSAQMRDVLTRKLGKPRRVDRTLDELLRQLAKRHKFTATLASVPHLLSQLTTWRVSLGMLNNHLYCKALCTQDYANLQYPTILVSATSLA